MEKMNKEAKISTILGFPDKCMIIRVRPESILIRGSLYEAVRRCWKTNINRARQADYVLAVVSTLKNIDYEVKGVFKPRCWSYPDIEFCEKTKHECINEYEVKPENCKKYKRVAFIKEKEIPDDSKYLHKLLPDDYFPGQNPVRYTYKY